MREDAREDAYESLRTRLKDADRTVLRLKGVAAVEHSKHERAEGVLDGLVTWMTKLTQVMKGKPPSGSFVVFGLRLVAFAYVLWLLLFVVVSGNGRRETEVVQAELSHREDATVQSKNPLWEDIDKARVFAILRERAGQVPKAIEFCERVLRVVHNELFSLDEAPRKLEDLFMWFVQPENVRRMVRQQMQVSARHALAFVHSHWPGVDLMAVARGPPLGRDEPMSEHYAAATAPSAVVVKKILEEYDRIVGALYKVKEETDP